MLTDTVHFAFTVCSNDEWNVFRGLCGVGFKFGNTATANPFICIWSKTKQLFTWISCHQHSTDTAAHVQY